MNPIFLLALKSTIDAELVSLGASLLPSLLVYDIDDRDRLEPFLNTNEPGLLWELRSTRQDTFPGVWHIQIAVGVRTTHDSSNYMLLGIAGEIYNKLFQKSFIIYDKSKPTPSTTKLGHIFVHTARTVQQYSERSDNTRLVEFDAVCIEK